MQPIESKIEPEHLSQDSFLIGNIPIELVSYNVSTRFKMFLNRRVSSESIFYSSIGSFLNLFLIDNTLIKLIFYDVSTRFKTFLNRKVSLKSILYSSTRSFFIPFKYS